MEHRHRRIDRRCYLCPTAQARGSPLHSIRRLGLTRTDATLTRGEGAAPARIRTSLFSHRGFAHNTDGCYGPCNPPSRAHAVGAARMPHRRHAKNFAWKRLLLPLDTTPPRSDARQTARCAASTAVAVLVS
ncbi:hypothetical protein TcCL_Unassigned01891 [Trypanosoma cruzi]|nr:hypothetical protein TcCL_Unassigned01891 [Trypanosoma cruzi]